jgi:threonine dehydrogenase-like Zn-dependent dehydrogenase
MVFGHENRGIGEAVVSVKKGDRVVVPFNMPPSRSASRPTGSEPARASRRLATSATGPGHRRTIPSGGAEREDPSLTLNWLTGSVRATGRLGIPGAYFVGDPGAPSEAARQGRLELDWGTLWQKGIRRLGTGQCDCKRYMRRLRDLIIAGRAQPSFHRQPRRHARAGD